MTRQHVVLCEGFDDRAFWAGWLLHLGCEDPGAGSAGRRVAAENAWGDTVTRGKFLFVNPCGSMILVHPVDGRANARRAADNYFRFQGTKPVGRLIVNLDGDADREAGSTSALDVVDGIARSRLDFGAEDVVVLPVVWECPNAADVSGVPRQQTLERLVSAAVASAYDGRGRAVDDWLAAEPVGGKSHKSYGTSYFAKWYAAEHGYNDFYKALWRDEAVAAELETRLRATGAWQTVEELVAD